jgi:adenine-specific DNA-methyltransferase
MTKRTKLELTRIGKDNVLHLEPRILIKKPELSNSGSFLLDKGGQGGFADNMLIHGDNLLALKALEQDYAGKVKCIYIDPPYNTGNAFEHYDDGLEHSEWLNLMKPRLEILRNLLSDNGSIWISIDDDESHYLKILCDEVFGRKNFINNVIWEKKQSPQNDAKWLSDTHDHILVFAKNKELWRPNLLERSEESNSRYKNPDNDPRWPRTSWDLWVKTFSENYVYSIANPKTGAQYRPTKWWCWMTSKEKMEELLKDNRISFWKDGNSWPRLKRFLSEVKQWIVSRTIRYRIEVGDNQEAKREVKALKDDDIFSTPKPERLIERILHLWSNLWDLVLDSFLWSGTTAAVAHKMGRRWIGIELWDHAYTHAKVRMDKVIEGEQWGISKAVWWTGWGWYSFYELGPSLLTKDDHDNYIINPELDANKLMQALCKIEHFTYSPNDDNFIKHGYSTEQDFIHITTRLITQELLDEMSQMLSEGESLLILSRHVAKGLDLWTYNNIQVKKIPQAIMNKCEYDRDDYSLPITESDYQDDDDTEE